MEPRIDLIVPEQKVPEGLSRITLADGAEVWVGRFAGGTGIDFVRGDEVAAVDPPELDPPRDDTGETILVSNPGTWHHATVGAPNREEPILIPRGLYGGLSLSFEYTHPGNADGGNRMELFWLAHRRRHRDLGGYSHVNTTAGRVSLITGWGMKDKNKAKAREPLRLEAGGTYRVDYAAQFGVSTSLLIIDLDEQKTLAEIKSSFGVSEDPDAKADDLPVTPVAIPFNGGTPWVLQTGFPGTEKDEAASIGATWANVRLAMRQ